MRYRMSHTHAENKAHVESRLHARSPFYNRNVLLPTVAYCAKLQ
jgi:hypothetical protein